MVFGVLFSCALASAPARAQAPAPPPEEMSPPSLREHPEAAFPRGALEERVEGNVGLELDLDAAGAVVGVRVTTAGGPRLRRGGRGGGAALHLRAGAAPGRRRSLDGAVHLRVPSAARAGSADRPPPRRRPPAPAAEPIQSGPDQSTLVLGIEPISAASSFSVHDRDFQLRPIGSVQDILRVTPGLVMVQHSGGGKANQYFLRGFDADHGTDLALSIDGVPDQHGLARARSGLRRHELHHPRGGRARGDHQGPVLREPGRLRDRGRGEHGLARRLRAQRRRPSAWAARPGTARPAIAGLVIASPKFEIAAAEGDVRRRDRPHERPVRQPRGLGQATSCSTS